MIDAITAALEAVSPTTRKRLRRCLPMLQEALATWGGMMPASGLLLACSTQHNGIVLRASGWPQFDPQAVAQFDRANGIGERD
jgi:hypothetical protein